MGGFIFKVFLVSFPRCFLGVFFKRKGSKIGAQGGSEGTQNQPKIMKNEVQDRGLENVGKTYENSGSQSSWEALPLES